LRFTRVRRLPSAARCRTYRKILRGCFEAIAAEGGSGRAELNAVPDLSAAALGCISPLVCPHYSGAVSTCYHRYIATFTTTTHLNAGSWWKRRLEDRR
jgi:hypothetical protein